MNKELIDFVNTENLIWCRKKSGLDFTTIYKKANWSQSTKKIEKWERGEAFPTIRELKTLGKVYKKAWTLFLLEEDIPSLGFSVMKNFRGSFADANERERVEIIQFANEMEYRQGVMYEYADILEVKQNPFFGSLQNNKNVAHIADSIISELAINLEEMWRKKNRQEAVNFLQAELGKSNILICFSSNHPRKKIELNTMRGMLLRSSSVPVIGINSAESSKGARIFTIFHELVHLAIEQVNENEVFVERMSFRTRTKKTPIESLCDAVSAKMLVPDYILEELKGAEMSVGLVEQYCKRLKINIEPFLYRVQDFGLLDTKQVDFLMSRCREENESADISETATGGPNGGMLKLLKNGKHFVSSVTALYTDGHISYSQALGLLDTKAKTYNKFAH